jgi:hypothetical protein
LAALVGRVLRPLIFSPFFLNLLSLPSFAMENTNPGLTELINQTTALSWSNTPSTLNFPPANFDPNPTFMLVGKIISKITIRNNILHAWSFVKSLVSEDRGENMMFFYFQKSG